jgi:GNAT superfamily N-acetyltransferase
VSFELRELGQGDGCNALSLGNPAFSPLKSFLRKEAKRLHQEHLARTFVLVPKGDTKVLAYISTLCTHVAVEQFDKHAVLDGFRYKDYPAIKLARLAVDVSLQGQGIGSQLVDFVIGLVTEHVMPYTGCRFLVVDAKSESVPFYEAKGFLPIGFSTDGSTQTTTMFIDLRRVLEPVNQVSTLKRDKA